MLKSEVNMMRRIHKKRQNLLRMNMKSPLKNYIRKRNELTKYSKWIKCLPRFLPF